VVLLFNLSHQANSNTWQQALTIHPNNNHGTETQQSTSDFDANGNLLTLNNMRGWLGYCLCHRRKFADKILG
jgi:hypothetical protein